MIRFDHRIIISCVKSIIFEYFESILFTEYKYNVSLHVNIAFFDDKAAFYYVFFE